MSKWIVDIRGEIEGDYELIKKYEEPQEIHKDRTVQDFADRCKECGARYGKLLKQKSDMLDKIKEEIEAQSKMHMDGDLYIKVSECMQIIDKYKEGDDPNERKTES